MAVVFAASTVTSGTGTVTPILMRRQNGDYSAIYTGSTFSMTSGQTVKCVIGDDGSGGQSLTVYVNGTARLSSLTDIDDPWHGGETGLIVRSHASQALSFDNFKIGYDNSSPANGNIDDSGDDIQIDDDFASAQMTLTSDHAGNLTDDGVLLYVYDAWNRLVKVTRRLDAKNVVAEYEYDGLNRRIVKSVTNTGVGVVNRSNDVNGDGTADADGLAAGDRVEHYYYAGWRVIEETDAASTPHVLAQTVYGTQYIDEPVCRDRNTDYLHDSGSSDGDCVDAGGSQRYFYHQDANFRVVLPTDESGVAVERYDYDAYGEPRIWAGITSSSATTETGSLLSVSRVGNPLMHQGLRRDDETGLHENRYRTLHTRLGRFMQRDPLGSQISLNCYSYLNSSPALLADSLGLDPGDSCEQLRTQVDNAK